jgi:hypothetical protein
LFDDQEKKTKGKKKEKKHFVEHAVKYRIFCNIITSPAARNLPPWFE